MFVTQPEMLFRTLLKIYCYFTPEESLHDMHYKILKSVKRSEEEPYSLIRDCAILRMELPLRSTVFTYWKWNKNISYFIQHSWKFDSQTYAPNAHFKKICVQHTKERETRTIWCHKTSCVVVKAWFGATGLGTLKMKPRERIGGKCTVWQIWVNFIRVARSSG